MIVAADRSTRYLQSDIFYDCTSNVQRHDPLRSGYVAEWFFGKGAQVQDAPPVAVYAYNRPHYLVQVCDSRELPLQASCACFDLNRWRVALSCAQRDSQTP